MVEKIQIWHKIHRIFGLALFLSVFLFGVAGADTGTVRLRAVLSASSAKPGEEFFFQLEITENPGFSGVQLSLPYDTESMSCLSASMGSMLRASMGGTNPLRGEEAFLMAASLEETRERGELVSFRFRAEKEIPEIHLEPANVQFADASGNSVPYIIVPNASSQADSAGMGVKNGEKTDRDWSFPSNDGAQTAEEPEKPTFIDISGHWAEESIRQAAQRGIFHGYADGSFHPDDKLTRSHFMMVLWNMSERPAVEPPAPFADISALSADFQSAIAWAYSRGFIEGTAPGTFSPYGILTRQAAMKILFRYSGVKDTAMSELLSGIYDQYFQDSASIAAWARTPLYWSVYHEILTEFPNKRIAPVEAVTRGSLADILVRYTNQFPTN